MAIPEELKQNMFNVIEERISIKAFESWLYASVELSERMDENLILELYLFNYNQRKPRDTFREAFLKYFDENEFILWKVKANLQDLIDERENRDRILNDFCNLRWEGDLCGALVSIGYYMYEIEDIQYNGSDLKSIIQEMKRDAAYLLCEIEKAENATTNFELSDFEMQRP